jgi:hypothetical protein
LLTFAEWMGAGSICLAPQAKSKIVFTSNDHQAELSQEPREVRGLREFQGDLGDGALERRLSRNRLIVLIIATLVSLLWARRDVTIGIVVGGALGHLNQRWLSMSIKATLLIAASGADPVPAGTLVPLFLRYLIVAIGMVGAIWLGVAHPVGLAIGFAAFVGGVMIEAGALLYRGLREGASDSDAPPQEMHPGGESLSAPDDRRESGSRID